MLTTPILPLLTNLSLDQQHQQPRTNATTSATTRIHKKDLQSKELIDLE